MKAIALTRHLSISDPVSLIDTELPKPAPTGRDLLGKISAAPTPNSKADAASANS